MPDVAAGKLSQADHVSKTALTRMRGSSRTSDARQFFKTFIMSIMLGTHSIVVNGIFGSKYGDFSDPFKC
jgi:hypothetical protein